MLCVLISMAVLSQRPLLAGPDDAWVGTVERLAALTGGAVVAGVFEPAVDVSEEEGLEETLRQMDLNLVGGLKGMVSVRPRVWPDEHGRPLSRQVGWRKNDFRSLGVDALELVGERIYWRDRERRSGTFYVKDLQSLYPDVSLHWWAKDWPLSMSFESVDREELLQAVARAVYCEVRSSETGRALMVDAEAFKSGMAERVRRKYSFGGVPNPAWSDGMVLRTEILMGLTSRQVDELMVKPMNWLRLEIGAGHPMRERMLEFGRRANEHRKGDRFLGDDTEDILGRVRYDQPWEAQIFSSIRIDLVAALTDDGKGFVGLP